MTRSVRFLCNRILFSGNAALHLAVKVGRAGRKALHREGKEYRIKMEF